MFPHTGHAAQCQTKPRNHLNQVCKQGLFLHYANSRSVITGFTGSSITTLFTLMFGC